MDRVETIIIGAGIIGLACARELALRGHEVIVLEAAFGIGTQISSRHSEVIHAGIYYPSGSLKARLCVEGKKMLYRYCAERHIDHKRTGKLIIAVSENQCATLRNYKQQGESNGVGDLELITAQTLKKKEPNIKGVEALWSPSTGIFDSHSLMLHFQGDLENSGGMIAFGCPVQNAVASEDGIIVKVGGDQNYALCAKNVINAAGLYAQEIARAIKGLDPQHIPPLFYAKGNYFALSGTAPFRHLVYPVAEQGGLGIHATIDLAGQVRFGPDVEWINQINYDISANRLEHFISRIRTYYPALDAKKLVPAYAGIRPKLASPGNLFADFVISGPAIHGIKGLVNLFGIESPGATSSMAIARHVAGLLG